MALLAQALRPSNQATGFFAAISALLGLLFAFNAMLLTIPERRKANADLRLVGTRRSAIMQMVAFQALCLGTVASLLGLLGGYLLSKGAFHQSSGYLAEAFTLGTSTVIGLRPLLLSLAGGMLATCLASGVPLLDLRPGKALDAVYLEDGVAGQRAQRTRSAIVRARRERPARAHDGAVRARALACASRERRARVRDGARGPADVRKRACASARC